MIQQLRESQHRMGMPSRHSGQVSEDKFMTEGMMETKLQAVHRGDMAGRSAPVGLNNIVLPYATFIPL